MHNRRSRYFGTKFFHFLQKNGFLKKIFCKRRIHGRVGYRSAYPSFHSCEPRGSYLGKIRLFLLKRCKCREHSTQRKGFFSSEMAIVIQRCRPIQQHLQKPPIFHWVTCSLHEKCLIIRCPDFQQALKTVLLQALYIPTSLEGQSSQRFRALHLQFLLEHVG